MKLVLATAAVSVVAASASADISNPINVQSFSDLGSFVELDLTTGPNSVSGVSGASNNRFVSNFAGEFFGQTSFSGSIVSEVFGNVGTAGASLNTIAIKYTMTVRGEFAGVEQFGFGVNSGLNLDFSAFQNAQQGVILADSTLNQTAPTASLTSANGGDVDYFLDFPFFGEADPNNDTLGESGGIEETLTWYLVSSGDVAVNVVGGVVENFGGETFQALSFVSGSNQDDLGVPTPGAAALAGVVGLAVSRRRRNG